MDRNAGALAKFEAALQNLEGQQANNIELKVDPGFLAMEEEMKSEMSRLFSVLRLEEAARISLELKKIKQLKAGGGSSQQIELKVSTAKRTL